MVTAALEVRVDKTVKLAELELQCALDIALAIDLAYRRDNTLGVFNITLVIVGEIIDKEVFKIECSRHHHSKYIRASGV